jgi:hypothetical protein
MSLFLPNSSRIETEAKNYTSKRRNAILLVFDCQSKTTNLCGTCAGLKNVDYYPELIQLTGQTENDVDEYDTQLLKNLDRGKEFKWKKKTLFLPNSSRIETEAKNSNGGIKNQR